MARKTVYHSEQEAETGFNRAIQAYINRGDEDLAQEVEDAGLDAWLESSGRRIENPAPATLALVNPEKRRITMPRENQAEKIARLEAELDDANSRIEELEDERADALSSLAESYGVEVFDPGDGEDGGADTELEDEESGEES